MIFLGLSEFISLNVAASHLCVAIKVICEYSQFQFGWSAILKYCGKTLWSSFTHNSDTFRCHQINALLCISERGFSEAYLANLFIKFGYIFGRRKMILDPTNC